MKIPHWSLAGLLAAALATTFSCKEPDRELVDETPSNPKVEELDAIAGNEAERQEPIIAERPAAEARIATIERKLEELQSAIASDPALESEHGEALRSLEMELDEQLTRIERELRELEEDVGA